MGMGFAGSFLGLVLSSFDFELLLLCYFAMLMLKVNGWGLGIRALDWR